MPRKPSRTSSAATRPRKRAVKAPARRTAAKPAARKRAATPGRGVRAARNSTRLLSGGNPQIAKGYGNAPVQAYIAAMPGWKRAVGRRLDRIIGRVVPGVNKAVKWNSPLYGIDGDGWFLGIHVFEKYVKVAFFRGRRLRPMPPVESRHRDVRYWHIREDEPLDEARFADWVAQASRLPGERM